MPILFSCWLLNSRAKTNDYYTWRFSINVRFLILIMARWRMKVLVTDSIHGGGWWSLSWHGQYSADFICRWQESRWFRSGHCTLEGKQFFHLQSSKGWFGRCWIHVISTLLPGTFLIIETKHSSKTNCHCNPTHVGSNTSHLWLLWTIPQYRQCLLAI